MALAHNGIIRGLNSIYLQAANIPSKDLDTVKDFLTYCQCWCESMHHHHDAEEQELFPSVERLSGVKGLMARNVEQHRAFTPGFDAFYEYSKTCAPKDYDGQHLRGLIEDFAEPLIQHLHDEIDTLRALDKYDNASVRQAYKRLEKILMSTDHVSFRPEYQPVLHSLIIYLATHRTLSIRHFRSRFRRCYARLPVSAVLRTLYHPLCVREEVSWCMAIQSVHGVEGAQGVGVFEARSRDLILVGAVLRCS